jgi:transposase
MAIESTTNLTIEELARLKEELEKLRFYGGQLVRQQTWQLAHADWCRSVQIKSEGGDNIRVLTGARERLVRIRKEIENRVQGVLKTYGIRLQPVTEAHNRASFRDQLRRVLKGDPALETIVGSLIIAHETVCAGCADLDASLVVLERKRELVRRLARAGLQSQPRHDHHRHRNMQHFGRY